MKRLILLFVLLFTSACGRLDTILYSPSQTPETWLQIQPYAEFNIGTRTIIFVQRSTSIIVYLLLECSRKGRGGVSSEGQTHRDAPGCEHAGKPLPPMREKLELLNSCCYLVARWILVWDGTERQTRIGVYHSRPENPRPNLST